MKNDGSISIDSRKLQPPPNIYDADSAYLEHRRGDVRIFFGKLKLPKRKSLRTRVEIRYPIEAFYCHFWQNSRDFHERVRTFARERQLPEPGEQHNLCALEADRDHSEWANFDYMAHSGTEAVIDFFHLPPAELARFTKTGETGGLDLEAILRIQLDVSQLLGLLDSCDEAISEIQRHLPRGAAGAGVQEEEP